MPIALIAALVAAGMMTGGPVSAGDTTASRGGDIHRGADEQARALIGKPAPALPVLPWLDGRSRTSRSLAGKVVVLRNFTNGCPFCVTTIPALEQIHRDFGPRGVVVLGVYHPKPPRPVTV